MRYYRCLRRRQFLNVIESVFSGMARAVIHNSDYATVTDAQAAITRYLDDRNRSFALAPQKAGRSIWGPERMPAAFASGEQLQGRPISVANTSASLMSTNCGLHRMRTHFRQLFGRGGKAGVALRRLPVRSQERACHGRDHRPSQAAERTRPFRPTNRSSMSSRVHLRDAQSMYSTWSMAERSSPMAAYSSTARQKKRPTAFGSMSTAICGVAGA